MLKAYCPTLRPRFRKLWGKCLGFLRIWTSIEVFFLNRVLLSIKLYSIMKMYSLKYKNMDGRIPKETIPQISILSSSKVEEKRMGLLEMSTDLPGIMTMDLLKLKLLVSLEMDMKNTL